MATSRTKQRDLGIGLPNQLTLCERAREIALQCLASMDMRSSSSDLLHVQLGDLHLSIQHFANLYKRVRDSGTWLNPDGAMLV